MIYQSTVQLWKWSIDQKKWQLLLSVPLAHYGIVAFHYYLHVRPFFEYLLAASDRWYHSSCGNPCKLYGLRKEFPSLFPRRSENNLVSKSFNIKEFCIEMHFWKHRQHCDFFVLWDCPTERPSISSTFANILIALVLDGKCDRHRKVHLEYTSFGMSSFTLFLYPIVVSCLSLWLYKYSNPTTAVGCGCNLSKHIDFSRRVFLSVVSYEISNRVFVFISKFCISPFAFSAWCQYYVNQGFVILDYRCQGGFKEYVVNKLVCHNYIILLVPHRNRNEMMKFFIGNFMTSLKTFLIHLRRLPDNGWTESGFA